ncbi:MAG: CADD family putative folate metabolism protein [Dehalococcoidia bacterium]|nr:CADD family putative folate metabolism protein [Dehalococcoidia bacterium]
MTGLIARLQGRIQGKSLLKHPFYQDWQAGKLSLNDLRVYAAQYYQFESNFPVMLSAIHTHCSDAQTRQIVLENLWDEEHGPRNHAFLWLQFAAALGMSKEDVLSAEVLPETKRMVDTLKEITSKGSYQEGLAAMYAYEHQVPAIAEEKERGLREFYGLTTPEAVEFFTLHSGLDVEHSEGEARAIASGKLTNQQEQKIEQALDRSLDVLWGFLDGVQRIRMQKAAILA